ncbi:MAG TPA: ABC transporter permease [Oscillospiraceae bacterium]|nr:ABC transporter permease [Oscillospiraceae bacterium]HPK34432.1 ABC transporter permease [Oscillospiraceae bacterium]HPR75583.1 ABC transporter permease [Oscillospiraceae bacterium]
MKNNTLLKVLKTLGFILIFIAVWQLLYFVMVEKAAVWKPYVFPSPLGVLNSYEKLVNNGTLFAGIGQTLRRIGIGYGISILIGLFLGMLLARFKALSELMKPLVLGIQTLPSICWVPFAILWYGLAESATIFIVVIGSTFSICIAVETGIRSINPLYIRAAKTMGAKGPALYTKVILPASVPSLVGALKQGWSFAWRALMTGEMMMSSKGIGLMLSQAREIGGINEVTAVMLVIVLISIFVDKLIFGFIEKHALKWT